MYHGIVTKINFSEVIWYELKCQFIIYSLSDYGHITVFPHSPMGILVVTYFTVLKIQVIYLNHPADISMELKLNLESNTCFPRGQRESI